MTLVLGVLLAYLVLGMVFVSRDPEARQMVVGLVGWPVRWIGRKHDQRRRR